MQYLGSKIDKFEIDSTENNIMISQTMKSVTKKASGHFSHCKNGEPLEDFKCQCDLIRLAWEIATDAVMTHL